MTPTSHSLLLTLVLVLVLGMGCESVPKKNQALAGPPPTPAPAKAAPADEELLVLSPLPDPGELILSLSHPDAEEAVYVAQLTLPVLATWNESSDYTRFSLDAAGDNPDNFNLALAVGSGIVRSGAQTLALSGDQLNPESAAALGSLVTEWGQESGEATSLLLSLDVGERGVSGTLTGEIKSDGGEILKMEGRFHAPLTTLDSPREGLPESGKLPEDAPPD